ncbi:hypothetical protein ACQPW1_25745 [Nocardia sp. CA-128927]
MGIFRKATNEPDEQPAESTAVDAEKVRKRRRRLLGGYYGGNGGI